MKSVGGVECLDELNGACQARACFGTAKTLRAAKTSRAAPGLTSVACFVTSRRSFICEESRQNDPTPRPVRRLPSRLDR
jgi:hypothetical protein